MMLEPRLQIDPSRRWQHPTKPPAKPVQSELAVVGKEEVKACGLGERSGEACEEHHLK